MHLQSCQAFGEKVQLYESKITETFRVWVPLKRVNKTEIGVSTLLRCTTNGATAALKSAPALVFCSSVEYYTWISSMLLS